MIRDAVYQDIPQILDIYNHYVEHTIITFDRTALSEVEFRKKLDDVQALHPFLVYCANDTIIGFCYATRWKQRKSYQYSAETTVYVKHGKTRGGIGNLLYQELIERLKKQHIHCAIAGISLPNPLSVEFHEKFGFKKIGEFPEVGKKFGKWVDVGYWSLILEN